MKGLEFLNIKATLWKGLLKYCVGLHAQSCLTLCNSMDCSPPGSSVCRISQARIVEWVAISSSRGSSWTRGGTHDSFVSCTAGGFFITEPLEKSCESINVHQIVAIALPASPLQQVSLDTTVLF